MNVSQIFNARLNSFKLWQFLRDTGRLFHKKLPLNCNELIPKREDFVFGKTYLEACNLVFLYEFCEISKNTFFTQHLQTTVSEQKKYLD